MCHNIRTAQAPKVSDFMCGTHRDHTSPLSHMSHSQLGTEIMWGMSQHQASNMRQ